MSIQIGDQYPKRDSPDELALSAAKCSFFLDRLFARILFGGNIGHPPVASRAILRNIKDVVIWTDGLLWERVRELQEVRVDNTLTVFIGWRHRQSHSRLTYILAWEFSSLSLAGCKKRDHVILWRSIRPLNIQWVVCFSSNRESRQTRFRYQQPTLAPFSHSTIFRSLFYQPLNSRLSSLQDLSHCHWTFSTLIIINFSFLIHTVLALVIYLAFIYQTLDYFRYVLRKKDFLPSHKYIRVVCSLTSPIDNTLCS